jgi:hypothetical protein
MAQVRVRMYRQGIGDCFLLTFPKKPSPSHMLIDCGVLRGTQNSADWMKRVAANIRDTTSGRVDVLVVTHEHWDHVSGFIEAAQEFKNIKFGEVWLAWTEDPRHEGAATMRAGKEKARRALERAKRKLKGFRSAVSKERLTALNALSNFSDGFGTAGSKTTAAAMKWVKEKASRKVRFFVPGGRPVKFAGARIYVLGPPEDETLLKRINPSKRTPEVYQLASSADLGFAAAFAQEDVSRPFDPAFQLSEQDGKRDAFFSRLYYSGDRWRQIEDDWLGTSERLALQLDSHTNNTSLALAIELEKRGKVLLFPGDAQVGNWLSWQSLRWKIRDNRGESKEVTAKDLLARTVLYKVGHHASHNATLREQGLELMTNRDLVAMIPVEEGRAKDLAWTMPFPSLLQRLQEKTMGRVIRADRGVDPTTWGGPKRNVKPEKDYIDYMVDM